jgi:hypothetical protein
MEFLPFNLVWSEGMYRVDPLFSTKGTEFGYHPEIILAEDVWTIVWLIMWLLK